MCEQTIANRCSRTTFSLKLKSWSEKLQLCRWITIRGSLKGEDWGVWEAFSEYSKETQLSCLSRVSRHFIACSCFQMCCQRSAAEAQRRCLSTMESFGIKKSTKNTFERRQAGTSSRAWHRKSSRSSFVIWTTVSSSSSSSSSSQEISQSNKTLEQKSLVQHKSTFYF